MATALDVSERTVFRAKRRYADEGLAEVLQRRNQVNRYRKLDDQGEAHLIAFARSPAPEGQDHWTLRGRAGKTVELGLLESLSHETVRLRLKKTRSSRGKGTMAHSQGERRLRGSYGGCPGFVCRTLRSPEAGGLL